MRQVKPFFRAGLSEAEAPVTAQEIRVARDEPRAAAHPILDKDP
ncbi:MAG: hypothetical protein ACRD21_27215 [Vicinamibacteria bacterium]